MKAQMLILKFWRNNDSNGICRKSLSGYISSGNNTCNSFNKQNKVMKMTLVELLDKHFVDMFFLIIIVVALIMSPRIGR